MKNIKFHINPENIQEIQSPFFLLEYDSWDDYSRRTSFELIYFNKQRKRYKIGYVKIMHESEFKTLNIIDKVFDELSEEFCSLGQDMEYYTTLYNVLGKEDFNEALNKINDVAFYNALADKFEHYSNFRVSLIRNSEAQKAFKEAKSIIYGLPQEQNFIFTYKCDLDHTDGDHTVNFNFGDSENLPNRMISLIGKNGTGKTQFLAKFALDLSGQSKSKLKDDTFTPSRPLFSKVIAVSYSAFDKFARPQKDKSFSYKYCGLKDEDGRLLSGPKLVENYKESVGLILSKSNRALTWFNVMKTILDEELADLFYTEIFENENYEIVNNKNSKLLSSGQSFLMYVITEILAHIKKNSILLFDEPEMHLHPNAIANFIRMIEYILQKFDSYAILATHSPIILQEIPGRYVNVFERQGNVPMVYKLGIESFGENIDVLTEKVFKTMEVDDNYKHVLKNLSELHSYKSVLSIFENKLSLSATTFLLNQYENPEKELNA
ncbi:AAA family ATPase [Flavobacterium sandaracinum]|uniref:ATP-binding protein n=1 Tax=Flavobacterium sandaracinum TaxID=2541733 RepID=A0A4R5CMD7_9FLAO|nr:AAA family ATPase [Flavobacterium sandaracinum]TDE01532.1 ATP-binding protein [Flavobacterium sandaracinum]